MSVLNENWISGRLKTAAKIFISEFYDRYEDIFHLRPELVPPRKLNYNEFFSKRRTQYIRDFADRGEEHFEILQRETGLIEDASVIDLGSGLGRIARPLSRFLSQQGRYVGYDVVRPTIDWCRTTYLGYPNFVFRTIPTPNTSPHYALCDDRFSHILSTENLEIAPTKEGSFRFNEESGTVDLVFSFSVFTSIYKEQVLTYLRESFRVLKPGGKTFHTQFLLDESARETMESGRTTFYFPHSDGKGHHFRRLDFPLQALAFDLTTMLGLYQEAGFRKESVKVIRGSWSNDNLKSPDRFQQDVIVAIKGD